MDVFEVIRTTRAMRRLDPDRDVSDADVMKILDAATRGPSGGNSQPARWMVVRDRDKRKRLGEIYAACWGAVRQGYASAPDADRNPILRSADHLGEHMGDAPVIIIPCARGRGAEASVYGCLQNLFLAARALGLGTTLTTVHRMREADVKAVLEIPEDVTTYAMVPVGYPLGKWGEAKRRPAREIVYWDTWRNPAPE